MALISSNCCLRAATYSSSLVASYSDIGVSPKNKISFLTFLNQNSNLRNSIQISSNKITINDLIISQDLSNFLIRFFNYSHFSNPSLNALKYPDNNPEEILLTKESQVIADSLPDPKYITWCMNNVDSFNLSENDYLDLKKLNSIYPSIILTKTEENKIEFKLLAYIQYHS